MSFDFSTSADVISGKTRYEWEVVLEDTRISLMLKHSALDNATEELRRVSNLSPTPMNIHRKTMAETRKRLIEVDIRRLDMKFNQTTKHIQEFQE